jgi:hypothetical protein
VFKPRLKIRMRLRRISMLRRKSTEVLVLRSRLKKKIVLRYLRSQRRMLSMSQSEIVLKPRLKIRMRL